MKRTTGHLAEKNGKWYAVINLYDTEGRRKEKWASLDLEAKRGTKTEANHSDMGTTANIYSHLDSNSKIASAATIGNALALSDEE